MKLTEKRIMFGLNAIGIISLVALEFSSGSVRIILYVLLGCIFAFNVGRYYRYIIEEEK